MIADYREWQLSRIIAICCVLGFPCLCLCLGCCNPPSNNNGQGEQVNQPGSNASTSFPATEHATEVPPDNTLVGNPHALAVLSEVAIGETSASGMLETTQNPAGDRLPEAVPWAIPMEENSEQSQLSNSEHSDQEVSFELQGNNNAFPL